MSQLQRRHFVGAAFAGALPFARAQAWPDRPIKLIVPFGAGTTTDIVARIAAASMGPALGQALVIENKAGGGGGIGCAQAAGAPADGYTLLMGTASTHGVNPALYRKLPYDAERDFTPIGFAGYTANLLIVSGASSYRSVADLKSAAARDKGLTFASAGTGTTGHLAAELLKSKLGGQMVHAAYKDGGQALTDLASGQVDYMFYHPAAVMPHVATGRLRVLGISSARRSAVVPQAVPLAEQGMPDFDLISWFMLYAQAATPKPVLDKLRTACRSVLAGPEMTQKYAAQGIELRSMSPAEMVAFNKAELAKWSALVKSSGATAD